MRLSTSVLAALASTPAALAAPAGDSKQSTSSVAVTVKVDAKSSATHIHVRDSESYAILASSESGRLDAGLFKDSPLVADVNHEGAGSITIGDKKYEIHENPKTSGGIKCFRIYNPNEAFVNCAVELPNDTVAGAKAQLAQRADGQSAQPESGLASVAAGFAIGARGDSGPRNMAAPPPGNSTFDERAIEVEKRQACGPWVGDTIPYGDGDPHQTYRNRQLSQVNNCGAAPSCGVGESQSKSYNEGWSVSLNINKWITGGFSVSETWTTGNSYNCNGAKDDSVCIWYETAYTAYTVQNRMWNPTCGGEDLGETSIVWSPNDDNRGGKDYYCVIGTCRKQGDEWWDNTGRAGGPGPR